MAWRILGYDRVLIQLLSEHPKTGFVDETVIADFEMASQIINNGDTVVLVNDLTTILRHGDLTIVHPNKNIEIVEVKTGKGSRRSGRASRQKKTLNELADFLNTGTRLSKEKTQDYLFRADTSIQTYHSVIADVINKAKQDGYQRMIISDCFAIEVVWVEHPKAYLPKKRPFENVEHTFSYGNLDVFDRPTPRAVPYGIFPFDDKICFDLVTGRLQIVATVNFDALVKLFNQFGLILELPQPNQQEIKDFSSASVAEIRKIQSQMQDRHLWFTIKDGNNFLRISPDYWFRILHEFMHEKTFVETQLSVMHQSSDLEISDDRVTRFYVGYKDESAIWF
jgi:hypothetical protein